MIYSACPVFLSPILQVFMDWEAQWISIMRNPENYFFQKYFHCIVNSSFTRISQLLARYTVKLLLQNQTLFLFFQVRSGLHHQWNLLHHISLTIPQSQFVHLQMNSYRIYRWKCHWWSWIPMCLVLRKWWEICLLRDQVERSLLEWWLMFIVLHQIRFDQKCFLEYLSFHRIMTLIIVCFNGQTVRT